MPQAGLLPSRLARIIRRTPPGANPDRSRTPLMAVATSRDPLAQPGEHPNGAILPLHNGARLPRAGFERGYEAMPHLKKAELIEGVVYVASPVRHQYHGKQHSRLVAWLVHYEASTPGVEVGDNSTVRLDLD